MDQRCQIWAQSGLRSIYTEREPKRDNGLVIVLELSEILLVNLMTLCQ